MGHMLGFGENGNKVRVWETETVIPMPPYPQFRSPLFLQPCSARPRITADMLEILELHQTNPRQFLTKNMGNPGLGEVLLQRYCTLLFKRYCHEFVMLT